MKREITSAKIESLHIYPVKSCGSIDLFASDLPSSGFRISARGFEFDREWVLAKESGNYLSQRDPGAELLALVLPILTPSSLRLSAPGMPAIEVPLLHEAGAVTRVQMLKETLLGVDCGDQPSSWFSAYLGFPVRLVHLSPDSERKCDAFFTGSEAVLVNGQDGFPFHVVSLESLPIIDEELAKVGQAPISLRHFRPNIVLSGLGPFGEDFYSELRMPDKDIFLKNIKPCGRCGITNIRPESAEVIEEKAVSRILNRMRLFLNSKKQKFAMFGQNTVAISGIGEKLVPGTNLIAMPGATGFAEGEAEA